MWQVETENDGEVVVYDTVASPEEAFGALVDLLRTELEIARDITGDTREWATLVSQVVWGAIKPDSNGEVSLVHDTHTYRVRRLG